MIRGQYESRIKVLLETHQNSLCRPELLKRKKVDVLRDKDDLLETLFAEKASEKLVQGSFLVLFQDSRITDLCIKSMVSRVLKESPRAKSIIAPATN